VSTHEIGDAAWLETTTAPLSWSSGRWSLELRDDELADIRFDGRLSLRSIRGVARDRDWGTIPPVVTSVESTETTLTVEVSLIERDADLRARLVVSAEGSTLSVNWTSTSLAPFLRARLGLVVLHPPEITGETLEISHPDGEVETSAFPLGISAHQPAFDIAGLAWQHAGLSTALTFEGDVFEMEDQRNWTDASFKTYSTPLSVPFPVLVETGEVVAQSVRIEGTSSERVDAATHADHIELVEAGRVFPSIGTSASTGAELPEPTVHGDFLLVELPAHTPAWRAALDHAVIEAGALPLDVRIIASTTDQLDDVAAAIRDLKLVRVAVFSADTHVSATELWAALEKHELPVALLGGTRAHFTELNRRLGQLPPNIPAYSFSITPEMHATGREQIVESIAMQRLVAENAVRLTGAAVHIGPITLRSRFNAVATTRTPDAEIVDLSNGYGAAVMPDATDARQAAPALAAWTVASAAALAIAGVESISWFEASGPRGVRGLPVETAIEWLSALTGSPLLEAPDAATDLWAIGAVVDGSPVALVANLRAESATVTLVVGATERIVELAPFSAARIAL
jgi:hypothetical protein